MAQPECINIRICPTTNVLISNNLLVRKNCFNSTIVWNENVRLLRHFSKDFEVDLTSMFTCDVIKARNVNILTLGTRFVNFSHGTLSYTFSGENVKMLEC